MAQSCYGMFARNDDYCAQKIILLKEEEKSENPVALENSLWHFAFRIMNLT